MMRKTVIIVFITITLLSGFCSCSVKERATETTANESVASTAASSAAGSTTSAKGSDAGTAADTTVYGNTTDKTVQEQTTVAVTGTSSVSSEVKVPGTPAEIVHYFNAAANKVKTEKPGYRFTQTPHTDINKISISENIPLHSFISKFIVSAINKSNKEAVVVGGSSHNDFPVKEKGWASKLEPEALTAAAFTDKGSYYEIEMTFREEKLSALPDNPEKTAHGKVFSLLTNKEFRQAFGGFDMKLPGLKVNIINEKFEPTYRGSSIKCKIDKQSGSMINAVYYLNTYSEVDMGIHVNNKNETIGIKMEYSVTDEYIFS